MKNLKKLSVVLFATLLSLNFTSCIDDGVSDAVDQVYLAQAEFLKAQAALKEADAQKVLAEAAYQEALAAVQLAGAAKIDAETEGIILDNEAQAETNAFDAQVNVMDLAVKAAELEVTLQEQLTLLAEAQSAYEVAMVSLGEAVADAKNDLISEYYADYNTVVSKLNNLYEQKIEDENDLALKKLMLVALDANANPVDLVSMAYLQASLEADLADSEAMLVAKQAALATAEAITADDASDAQKLVTELYEQAQAIIATNDQLRVELAEADVAADQAYEAWEAATDEYDELIDAGDLLKTAIANKKAHTDAIADAEEAIADAAANEAALPAAEAAVVAVDTTTAFNAIATAKQLIETKEGLVEDAEDDVDAAEETYNDALAAYDTAADYLAMETNVTGDPTQSPLPKVMVLEAEYTAALHAFNNYNPALTVADAQTALDAAAAAEAAAQAAWGADPTGSVVEDNAFVAGLDDLDETGITGGTGSTYMRVATWVEVGNTGRYIPATFYPGKYQDVDPLAADGISTAIADILALDGTVIDGGTNASTGVYDFVDAETSIRFWLQDGTYNDGAQANIGNFTDRGVNGSGGVASTTSYPGEEDITHVVFVEVEADDTETSNIQVLYNTRYDAAMAQAALVGAQLGLQGVQDDVDDALEAVEDAYAALGYTFPAFGEVDFSDYYATQEILADFAEARDDAHKAWNNSGVAYQAYPGAAGYKASLGTSSLLDLYNAEKAVADAEAALGTDFRTGYVKNSFLNEFENWYNASTPATVVTAYGSTTTYERFEGIVNAEDDVENIDEVPHENPTAYEALRNAYFEVMWAMEAVEALETVEYTRLYDGTTEIAAPASAEYSNADATEYATADKAALEALLPAHDLAIADLQARYDALLAEFGFDTTAWDFQGDMGYDAMGELNDLPLYAAYLDAMEAKAAIQAEIDANRALRYDIVQVRQAVIDNLIDDVTVRNVDLFLEDVADQIEELEEDIAELEDTIEVQKGLVATGIVDADTAQAWIVECERQLTVLDSKIEVKESEASNLLARINALLN